MTVIGIDVGFTGAIAIYNGHDLEVHDMPVMPLAKGKNGLNHHAILEILSSASGDDATVWIEQVSAMPGQGVSSVFRFGQQLGALEMACASACLPIRYVTPAKWKKHFGLSRDKGASRSVACQRFPRSAGLFARVKDDGKAEACLIALYGMEVGR